MVFMAIQRKILIAAVGEIPVGRTHLFRFGVANGIALNDGGTIKAYVNRCTHMGGPVELVNGKETFRCKWHFAEFDPHTGEAIQGEAPKGTRLAPIETMVENNNIYGLLVLPDDPFSF